MFMKKTIGVILLIFSLFILTNSLKINAFAVFDNIRERHVGK